MEQGSSEGEIPNALSMARYLRASSDVLRDILGEELQERLEELLPALIVWDVREDRTSFCLDHTGNSERIQRFIGAEDDRREEEKSLPPHAQWYLAELCRDLREILDSEAFRSGKALCSRFAIHNSPPAHIPLQPEKWHPLTIAFIERIRPELEELIKARYVDSWLQTPLHALQEHSPIQMIEYGKGERVLSLLEEMRYQDIE